ncbi:MAG: 2-phosphosulfolactate phosphatase [Spirochaetes bacterium]|nr:2-phosphosulfolactate phosphatase [Spirochaetota bacterium]
MKIQILHLVEGARNAIGLTVVIDVFRAFSTACFLKANGAERIIPIADLDLAYRIKREHPSFVLIGERGGIMQPGFDYGNSPVQIKDVDFSGKTVILSTSAGTQGIQNANGASEILTGSFVNAGAVIRYIQKQRPEHLSLVCMGLEAVTPTDEDTLLAEYIQSVLEGKPIHLSDALQRLRETSGKRFFNPATQDSQPEADFYLCLELDRFPFVLRAEPLPLEAVLSLKESKDLVGRSFFELIALYP